MTTFIKETETSAQDRVTPTLSQVLREAMKAAASEMNVCMPAKVVKYNKKNQTLDVQPYRSKKYRDGVVEPAPIIYGVPFSFPRAGNSFIHFPIKKGNTVTLFFSDHSLEKWFTSGKQGDPEDARNHHLSDAIAYPGTYPGTQAANIHNTNDLIIKNEDVEIRVKPNGKIQILNQKYDLMKIIDEWMTASISGSHTYKLRIRQKFRTFLFK